MTRQVADEVEVSGPPGPPGANGAAGAAGANGIFGGAVSFEFQFNPATPDGDPGAGFLALNNNPPNASTTIRISNFDVNGASVGALVAKFGDSLSFPSGYIRVVEKTDATKWLTFRNTTVTLGFGGAYHNILITAESGSGASPFASGDHLVLCWDRVGDAGTNGTNGTNGTPGTNGTNGINGTNGQTNVGLCAQAGHPWFPWSASQSAPASAQNTAIAMPVLVPSPMVLDSVSFRSAGTGGTQAMEWRLYQDTGSSTLPEVAGANGSLSFSAAANSTQRAPVNGGGTVSIAAGYYWLVVRVTSATALSFGQAGNANPGNSQTFGGQSKAGVGALGATLDFVTGWTKFPDVPCNFLCGRVFGQATPWA